MEQYSITTEKIFLVMQQETISSASPLFIPFISLAAYFHSSIKQLTKPTDLESLSLIIPTHQIPLLISTSEQKQTVTEILCLLSCTFVTLNSRQVSNLEMVLNVIHNCQNPTELKQCIILNNMGRIVAENFVN
jgi:hypothetical protein